MIDDKSSSGSFIFFCICAIMTSALQPIEHWQCSLPRNKSIYDSLSLNRRAEFDEIGYYASWLKENISFVSCYQRGFTHVPGGLRRDVQSLDLRRNSIYYIKKYDLFEYKNLVSIKLQQNCFSDNIARQKVPSCFYNTFQIEDGSFSYLSKLKYLDLSENNIKTIPLRLPKSLMVLNCELTILKPPHGSDFTHLKSLETVMFGQNCIGAALLTLCRGNFSVDNLSFPKSLSHMDISYNNLKRVPHWLFGSSLLGLSLQGNPIHLVRPNDFKNCPNLKQLVLSWTAKFDKIPLTIMKGAFDNLTQLVVLHLSGNMLQTLPDFASYPKPFLSGLGLAFNCLNITSNLPNNPISVLSSSPLIGLGLTGNTFCENTSYPIKKRIRKLNLSNAFANLTHLRTLRFDGLTALVFPTYQEMFWDLSYGLQYDYVDAESIRVLKDLQNLTTISLALSGIKFIDMSAFCMLQNLTSLDLGLNEIKSLSINDSCKRMKREVRSAIHANTTRDNPNIWLQVKRRKGYLVGKFNYNFLILHRNALTEISRLDFRCFATTSYLDLSYNHISYIQNDTFAYMKQLEILDLQFNPIRYLHSESTKSFAKLNTLMLNYSTYQGEFTLQFLSHLSNNIALEYGDVTDNIYRLLAAYRKNSTRFRKVISIKLTDIPIPIYEVANNNPIFEPFPNLNQITLLKAQLSTSLGDNFFGGITNLTNVTIRNSELREFPYNALIKLPNLVYLDLSNNYIESFNKSVSLNHLCHLYHLDLSHNFIRYIEPGSLEEMAIRGLQLQDLSHNYIKDFGPTIVDKNTLNSLQYLDLRGNAPFCDCNLRNNFGWLIYSNNSKLLIPGFLPMCSPAIIDYYGGCLTCISTISSHAQSLFLYSRTNTCEMRFIVILTVSITSFVSFFLLLSLILNSKSLRHRLINSWSRKFLLQTTQNKEHQFKCFVFDGFINYDNEDSVVGDWVDDVLVPKLQNGTPSFHVSVSGKEEWCGDTQVKQLLLKTKASRKTIVLLTEKFLHSYQCRYILSVLEDIMYRKGEDRCIIVSFQRFPAVGNRFQMRVRRNQWSVLNFPEPDSDDSMFWEILRNAMTSP